MDATINVVTPDADIEFMTSLGLKHGSFQTSCHSSVFFYHRNVCTGDSSKAILVLIHGYPEMNFMWRHVVPLLLQNEPLFIPDIPGYGRSTPSQAGHDKSTVGRSILEALRTLVASNRKQAVVIGGHDRGARICHRLGVDYAEQLANFQIRGILLLDIVPTFVQWQTFSNSKVAMGSFHWPLLASVQLATAMIKSLGDDVWCRAMMDRWAGKDSKGLELLRANQAIDIYSRYMSHESVIQASCEDYRAGAEEDIHLQKLDQESGRKLEIGTMILCSADYLGSRYDVEVFWYHWASKPSTVCVHGIGSIGHFIAEENPEETASSLNSFWQRLNGYAQVNQELQEA